MSGDGNLFRYESIIRKCEEKNKFSNNNISKCEL